MLNRDANPSLCCAKNKTGGFSLQPPKGPRFCLSLSLSLCFSRFFLSSSLRSLSVSLTRKRVNVYRVLPSSLYSSLPPLPYAADEDNDATTAAIRNPSRRHHFDTQHDKAPLLSFSPRCLPCLLSSPFPLLFFVREFLALPLSRFRGRKKIAFTPRSARTVLSSVPSLLKRESRRHLLLLLLLFLLRLAVKFPPIPLPTLLSPLSRSSGVSPFLLPPPSSSFSRPTAATTTAFSAMCSRIAANLMRDENSGLKSRSGHGYSSRPMIHNGPRELSRTNFQSKRQSRICDTCVQSIYPSYSLHVLLTLCAMRDTHTHTHTCTHTHTYARACFYLSILLSVTSPRRTVVTDGACYCR